MFDALGWRWEYEPIDLNGYIPDFVLMFPAGRVLVEVKPRFTVADLIAVAAEKIDQSGWHSTNVNDALIVGATWNHSPNWPVAGALRQWGSWAAAEWHTCTANMPTSVHNVRPSRRTIVGLHRLRHSRRRHLHWSAPRHRGDVGRRRERGALARGLRLPRAPRPIRRTGSLSGLRFADNVGCRGFWTP
jgi:hypothetical protein